MTDRAYDAANALFQDYATSGAFNISLSKGQVSALAMAVGRGDSGGFGHTAALVRKGLLAPITGKASPWPMSSETRPEYRATAAGLHVASLCRMAGLSQGEGDVVGAEIASLHAELSAARASEREALLDHVSLMARLDEAQHTIKALEFERDNGWPGATPPMIRLRDPRPSRSTAEIAAGLVGA